MIVEPLQRSIPPRRRDRHWVGQTRRKLAAGIDKVLTVAGYTVIVDPSKLWSAQGWWRTSAQADVMRMEGQIEVKVGENFHTWTIESWDTMTDLARGFTFEVDGWNVKLHANKSRTHPLIKRMKERELERRTEEPKP